MASSMASIAAAPRASRGLWRDAFRRLMRNGPAIVGAVFVGIFVVAAILAPILAPYDPTVGVLAQGKQGPTIAHLMGTDLLGRDELSRVLYGARRKSPLLVATDTNTAVLASDQMATYGIGHTVTHLEDGDVIRLTPGQITILTRAAGGRGGHA